MAHVSHAVHAVVTVDWSIRLNDWCELHIMKILKASRSTEPSVISISIVRSGGRNLADSMFSIREIKKKLIL